MPAGRPLKLGATWEYSCRGFWGCWAWSRSLFWDISTQNRRNAVNWANQMSGWRSRAREIVQFCTFCRDGVGSSSWLRGLTNSARIHFHMCKIVLWTWDRQSHNRKLSKPLISQKFPNSGFWPNQLLVQNSPILPILAVFWAGRQSLWISTYATWNWNWEVRRKVELQQVFKVYSK